MVLGAVVGAVVGVEGVEGVVVVDAIVVLRWEVIRGERTANLIHDISESRFHYEVGWGWWE